MRLGLLGEAAKERRDDAAGALDTGLPLLREAVSDLLLGLDLPEGATALRVMRLRVPPTALTFEDDVVDAGPVVFE